MQSQNQRMFPDCPCCGEHLEKKHEILDGLFQCPKCKNEHYFLSEYTSDILDRLSNADQSRNKHRYDEAFIYYESITQDHPNLIEAYWGLFLSTYGIVYIEENKNSRYIPAIHQFFDEMPTTNQHFLKVLQLSKDKYMKKHYLTECELITKTWETAKSTIKKVKPVKIKEPEVIPAKPIEPNEFVVHVTKPIGKDITDNYKIDPIIENKIKSAEQIYLHTHKFNRASKVFDDVLKADPLAKQAWWDKMLCTLQVSAFDALTANAKLDSIFEMFEQLMGCVHPKDENIYLQAIESHLFRKLIEASEFDQPLYDFIATWKKVGEQNLFSDILYQEIQKKLKLEGIISVDWVHQALAASTKYMPKQDQRFIKKYVDIAETVNQLGFYKDTLMLTQMILQENPNQVQTVLIQLSATYKVPNISELHTALRDMKFVKVLQQLLNQEYKALEVFFEIKLAALALIEQENYKLAIQMIETYVSLLPNDERSLFNQSLLEFSNHLIYHEKFKEAKKYINQLIENDPKIPAAHWAKFMIFLKAHTQFEVLMSNPKKDLMEYPDFEHAVNCTSDNKAYIQFYEIHDQLKQPLPQHMMFRKMARRNYSYFDDMCQAEGVETFVTTLFPQMEKEVPVLFKADQLSMFNLLNRTVIMLMMIAFALILSHMKTLFDPTNSVDPLVVSYQILLLFRDTVVMYLVPLVVLVYVVFWVREKENIGKAILGGMLSGLIVSIIALCVLGAIPWAIARFLTPTLFALSPLIVSGAVFGVSAIASFFLFRISHQKLVNAHVDKKFLRASIMNIIVMSLILLAGFVMTYLTIVI